MSLDSHAIAPSNVEIEAKYRALSERIGRSAGLRPIDVPVGDVRIAIRPDRERVTVPAPEGDERGRDRDTLAAPPSTAAQVSPEIIERVRTSIMQAPVAGLVGALTAMRERPDSTSLLPTLAGIPSLVMVGAEDMIIVERDGTTLVCPRAWSEEVRRLAQESERERVP